MDDLGFELTGQEREEATIGPIEQLIQAVLNEKNSPEILEFEQQTVQELQDKLKEKVGRAHAQSPWHMEAHAVLQAKAVSCACYTMHMLLCMDASIWAGSGHVD